MLLGGLIVASDRSVVYDLRPRASADAMKQEINSGLTWRVLEYVKITRLDPPKGNAKVTVTGQQRSTMLHTSFIINHIP